MPTYEYSCAGCQHEFEVFQGINDKPIKICPNCKARRARRKISAGSGLLFKGSGFYLTDYRSEGYKKKAGEEAKAAEKKPDDKKPDSKDSAGAKETKEPSAETSSGAKSATPNKNAPRKGESSK